MKSLCLAIALSMACGSQALAKTCHNLGELYVNAPSLPPNEIPWEICIEEVKFDARSGNMEVVSSTSSELFKNLKVERTVQRGPQEFVVSASSIFFQKQAPGCGRAQQAKVLIAGTSLNGSVSPKALKVYVEHLSTNDSCLQPAWRKLYSYEAF